MNKIRKLQNKMGYMLFWTLFAIIPIGCILPLVLITTGVIGK